MTVFRRRLFWKIYATLLVSLVAANVFMGAFWWFLGEAQQRGGAPLEGAGRDVSLYAADGAMIAARGPPIALSQVAAGRHWGPSHVLRLELPDGRIALTQLGPPARERARRILTFMLVVFGGVGLAAYPVTTRLTRRLEALRAGVARWGDGAALTPFDERGHDEVALLARTFNGAAARLDASLASQKALLANASHELRSPLARLRLAIEVNDTNAASHAEIVRNLAEMDQLVDELLLSSRLDHPESHRARRETIDLLGLAAEEAARTDATVTGEPVEILGDAVLLRRLIRNLLENAAKHGRPPVTVTIAREPSGATIMVGDAGAGIVAVDRDRIFEPFYRPAGSSEGAGGWGLGLALVRQIAARHGGGIVCRAAAEGGTVFVVRLADEAAT